MSLADSAFRSISSSLCEFRVDCRDSGLIEVAKDAPLPSGLLQEIGAMRHLLLRGQIVPPSSLPNSQCRGGWSSLWNRSLSPL
eukprot:6473781-Amphidinium_carterae.1